METGNLSIFVIEFEYLMENILHHLRENNSSFVMMYHCDPYHFVTFNSGCRADASEAAIILLASNITVFTLDFSGSGLSGGDHVTLGWYEVSGKIYKLYLSDS